MNKSTRRIRRESTAFLYSRLSRDDDLNGDSYSIKSQKALLTKVAKEKGYSNLIHYYDDGKSGVTMDRPGFNKMMKELEKGKASAVFFKDMSRLGRNYLEVGRLCEEFFPDNDIRYVAVSDNIDSDEGEDELTPIRNMFNEWYSRDISKKKRISNTIKGNSGVPMGLPPYGYLKDPDNTGFWIIDPEAANIVNRVFQMKADGLGSDQIAANLSEAKILTPTAYWKEKGIKRPSKFAEQDPYEWNSSTIHAMLKKQEYCGDVINFKTYSKSYKRKKRLVNDKEDMLIFEDIHEPVVSRDIFEKVTKRMSQGHHTKKKDGERNMFSGILRCADCGSIMHYHFNQANRNIEYFNCPGNNKIRKTCNETHYVRVDFLEQVILTEVRRLAQFVRDNKETFMKIVQDTINSDKMEKNSFKKKELSALISRDKELDVLFERIYEDNVAGKVSDDRFKKLSKRYEQEQASCIKRIKELEDEIEIEKNLSGSLDWFSDAIKKYTRIRKLTPMILHELVENIDVFHAEKINGTKQQRLIIYFNCIGSISLPQSTIKDQPTISVETRRGVKVSYAFA